MTRLETVSMAIIGNGYQPGALTNRTRNKHIVGNPLKPYEILRALHIWRRWELYVN